ASDTSNRRVPIRRTKGAVIKAFVHKADEYVAQLALLREAVPEGTPAADVAIGNACELSLGVTVDLVVTSPPYPATYDYLPLQQLRLAWANASPEDHADKEIGSRRSFRTDPKKALETWKQDTRTWVERATAHLAPGGHLVVVIGDGIARGKVIKTVMPTRKAAEDAGLTFVAGVTVGRRDQGVDQDKGEHLLVMQKPGAGS